MYITFGLLLPDLLGLRWSYQKSSLSSKRREAA